MHTIYINYKYLYHQSCNNFAYFNNYIDAVNILRKYIKSSSLGKRYPSDDSHSSSYKRKMSHANDRLRHRHVKSSHI